MAIPIGLALQVDGVDEDYVLITVWAADGMFAGTTSLYSGESAVEELARGLADFPRNPGDVREVVLGTRNPQAADGWVRLLGRCADRAGHVLLEVSILHKTTAVSSTPREAHMYLPVEPAALDAFVLALREFRFQVGERIELACAV